MKISKKYIGYESKNIENYSENTYDELVWELKAIEKSWKRNGGIIIENGSDFLHVSEDNGEGEIIFEIVD